MEAPSRTWEDAVRSLLVDPLQKQLVRECYFDPPIEQAANRFRASREWAAVRSVLGEPCGRALDLGAGNGIVSYALAADGWDTVAVEPDRSALVGSGAIRRLALAQSTSIAVVEAFGEAIPLPDRSFDLVVARQVLHHARELNVFCREVLRVLKPGGRLFAYRDHVVDNPMQLAIFLEQHPLQRLYGGEHAYSEREYEHALTSAGLIVERRWRQFEADFNFAPKLRHEVVGEAVARVFPSRIARMLTPVFGSSLAYPLVGHLLSAVDHRPGRIVAYLARRPA